MKKKVILIFVFFTICIYASCNNLDNLLQGKKMSFGVYQLLPIGNVYYEDGSFAFYREKNGKYFLGYLGYQDNRWEIISEREYRVLKVDKVKYYDDSVEISCISNNYNYCGNPSYLNFDCNKSFEISLNKSEIISCIDSNLEKEIIIDFSKLKKSSSSALIICDNLRIRESPNTNTDTKVIGKLKKWDKVTVTDCTEQKDKIDNLEYPWYKIKTEDGIEGWIFGGFAKIYFTEDDLELLYKAFEKEGSEYTNQFPTPDNS